MNEEENGQLNQKFENLAHEIAEIRKELDKKEDKVDKRKKYISWLIMGVAIIGFYATYYFYIMSLF